VREATSKPCVTPSLQAGANGKASLRRFDDVVANPIRNQDNYDVAFYDNDPDDRFAFGTPPRSSAGAPRQRLAPLSARRKTS